MSRRTLIGVTAGVPVLALLAVTALLLRSDTAEPGVPCTPSPSGVRYPPPGEAGRRWHPLAAYPSRHDELRAAAVGDVVLVGSGIAAHPDDAAQVRSIYAFDPDGGSYRRLTTLPYALDHPAFAAHGGHLYVAGGWRDGEPTAGLWRFSPADRRWTELARMRTARAAAAAAVLGESIYVVGGTTSRAATPGVPGLRSVEIYDIRSGSWSEGPDLPTARHHLGAGTLEGALYAVGGRDGDAWSLDAVERLDVARGSWTREPPLPLASGGVAVASTDDALVAVGGGDDVEGWVTPAAWSLDPGRGWSRLADLRVARHGHAAAAVGDRVFVFGGAPCAGYGTTRSAEGLDLSA